ncbi:hypothetical protein [Sandaracinus amylolyticus]|uniref:Uncharacterized protein n=1 Tax=Sandaracinus amylolyticus TaxID=927083 RepID=A0A0F6W7C6_9BACT|nr:hypothetical protein [Sandaracinus amylolyticus]AKF09273.1 hypothetical protein DB32_006422 [Sandaracinus amylolyticus]
MRRAFAVIVLALVIAPSEARADVVPYGWQPPAPEEETHVALFRASLAAWMSPDERVRLAARVHPRCGTVARRGSTGFGSLQECPSVDRIREVAIDRAVRFFAAEILDAHGRGPDAAALREAPPMRDPAARSAVLSRLTGDVLEPARVLAEHGMELSLEQIASLLGRLVEGAVRAGARRERIVQAAIEMLAELSRPLAHVSVSSEDARGDDRTAQLAARRAGACLQPEFDARWRPVAVRVAIRRSAAGVAVSSSGPTSVRACVERAVRVELGRERALRATSSITRIVAGPRGALWGAPLELAGD